MLKLRLGYVFNLLLTLPIIFFNSSIYAYSFDDSINSLSKQYEQKEYQTILTRLTALTPSKELADIFYYLKAESLKGLQQKNEAIEAYQELVSKFPKSEASKSALFTIFLLKLEEANEHNVTALEALALKLPTAWQTASAFEKLHNLNFIKPGKKSRYALNALRKYSQGANFYRQSPSSHTLLKQIWTKSEEYEFIENEWLEILTLTSDENLLDLIFAPKSKVLNLVSHKISKEELLFFKANWLCANKKYDEAIKHYNEVISAARVSETLKLNAKLSRGNCYHTSNKHRETIPDYLEILKSKNTELDRLCAEFRIMRSYFKLGNDAEAVKQLRSLINGKKMGWLLPTTIYEQGLECYDAGQFARSIEYFKFFNEFYIGHHRAQAALGYAIKASKAIKRDYSVYHKNLHTNYRNSFFIWWLDQSVERATIRHTEQVINKLSPETQANFVRFEKLWDSAFSNFVKTEANILSDKYPRNFGLFKALIELTQSKGDYQSMCGYGERLARQLLEAKKSLDEMPLWAWQAMYPFVYRQEVLENAKRFGIDPYWILAIMREESHFQVDIKSRSNAMSLMQILPTTGKWIAEKLGERGFKEAMLWDIKTNIRYGSWYLRYLSDLFGQDMILASAAYNGGQGNISRKVQAVWEHLPVLDRIDKVPMPETRDYYKKVMSSYLMYKRLYGK